MNIAFTMSPGRGDTDLLLHHFAHSLVARGFRLAGTVQVNTDRPDRGPCDMDVKLLPDGPSIRISQSLGKGARGCRLDPSALEHAVSAVAGRLNSGIDLLIINKFGKHEADGRGFRSVIAEALSQDVPVLVGLNSLNAEAFHAFTAGFATEIPPSNDSLMQWFETTALRELDCA